MSLCRAKASWEEEEEEGGELRSSQWSAWHCSRVATVVASCARREVLVSLASFEGSVLWLALVCATRLVLHESAGDNPNCAALVDGRLFNHLCYCLNLAALTKRLIFFLSKCCRDHAARTESPFSRARARGIASLSQGHHKTARGQGTFSNRRLCVCVFRLWRVARTAARSSRRPCARSGRWRSP